MADHAAAPGIATPDEVLAFWLGACPPQSAAMLRVHTQWFHKDAAFDRALRTRFAATLVAALAGELAHWARDTQGWLALLVVLDQFTRNAFRGQSASYAGDLQAHALALDGLAQGRDQEIPWGARLFCYLPLEHAEDLALQERAVALFDAALPTVAAEWQPVVAVNAEFARRHRDVIARYGRFPHRNAILGRESTAEEKAYLAQPGAGF